MDAVLIGIGLLVLGIPLALPLAALVFFGGLFPIIGALVAGALAVLVAFAHGGLGIFLAVAAIVLGAFLVVPTVAIAKQLVLRLREGPGGGP